MATMSECPDTGLPIYVDDSGEERKLGCLPTAADEESLLQASSIPNINPAEWITTTHEWAKKVIESFLSLYLLNQRSHGSCVGFSAAGSLMWDIAKSGFPLAGRLSGAYVYSWINGNRDAGASIVSALDALKRHGTCLESTVGWNTIYRSQIPASADKEAQRFMLETGSTLQGFDSFVTAGQLGKPVQFGVMVGRNFGSFDDEGCCGYGGPGSNHSVFAAPFLVKKKNGGYKIPLVNSWGSWGPFGTGWCYVDSRHIEGGGGGFIHGTPKFDPQAHQVG